LIESDGLIDQSVKRRSTSCHGTSLLDVRLETIVEHETFCFVVDIQRRRVGLKLLQAQRSRTSLPKAEELIFRLSFNSAVTVDVGKLLCEALCQDSVSWCAPSAHVIRAHSSGGVFYAFSLFFSI
jgi:hypothetical protein